MERLPGAAFRDCRGDREYKEREADPAQPLMWSGCHHSYLKRDSYGSGSSLPPLPQMQAWDCLRLRSLGKGQFKAQNHVEKVLPCWRSLMLPIVTVAQAGSCCQGRTLHLCPALSLFLEASPGVWAGFCRHTPLAVPAMFVWAGPALQEW